VKVIDGKCHHGISADFCPENHEATSTPGRHYRADPLERLGTALAYVALVGAVSVGEYALAVWLITIGLLPVAILSGFIFLFLVAAIIGAAGVNRRKARP
jgi:hypothetical protein